MKEQRSKTGSKVAGNPSGNGGPGISGLAMPAEWERHEATWLAWPHYQIDWPGKFEPVPWVFAEMARYLARGEMVHILVQPSKEHRAARTVREILDKSGVDLSRVRLHEVATDRAWIRDSGPIFARWGGKEGETKGRPHNWSSVLLAFNFNAWARYPNFECDREVPGAIAEILKLPVIHVVAPDNHKAMQDFVLEGGSIDVNGAGDLLTTEECLLSRVQRRNPGFSRQKIEDALRVFLRGERVHWLGRGIVGDDTHGHVDDLARFVNRDTIAVGVETRRGDVNYAATQDNRRRLERMRDGRGRAFNIVELPMPGPVVFNGQRLPASYANFYIANAGVLVPVFNDPADAVALRLLEACFKDRPVLPVYCRDLVLGRGTLHCLTQQQPAERVRKLA